MCCCWLVHKPIFLECCLRRAGEPGHYTYILLLSNGPIHGIKWSSSARARAHSLTLTVVAKREEDGARGQSSILVNSAETVTVSRDRGPLFSIALEGPIKTNLKLTASKAVMGRVTRPYPYPWWSQFGSPGQFGSSVHHLQKICGCCFHNNEIISVGIDQLDITTVTATTAGKRFSNEIVILYYFFLLFLTIFVFVKHILWCKKCNYRKSEIQLEILRLVVICIFCKYMS